MHPPWHLIPLIIKKIRLEQIRLMLITPELSNSWWSSITEKSICLEGPVYLDNTGKRRPKPPWNSLALIVNGKLNPLLH